jgi:hypothetical protein
MKISFFPSILLVTLVCAVSCKQPEKTYVVDAVHHSEDFNLPVFTKLEDIGQRRFIVIAEINESILVTKEAIQPKDSAAALHLQIEAKRRGGHAAVLLETISEPTSEKVLGFDCVSLHITGKIIKYLD